MSCKLPCTVVVACSANQVLFRYTGTTARLRVLVLLSACFTRRIVPQIVLVSSDPVLHRVNTMLSECKVRRRISLQDNFSGGYIA